MPITISVNSTFNSTNCRKLFLTEAGTRDQSFGIQHGYDLAIASDVLGNLEQARQQLEELIRVNDTAELHSLLGVIEEKSKNYLASAAQFEKAAHMDPSENNIFEWGTELLLHQTFEPAIEVFKAGLARYPQSSQMQIGFGVAQYGLGNFDAGAQAFFKPRT